MRQLAIFIITVFIFSITNFTTANAQTFGPDDDGFNTWNSTTPDWEEWMETCEGQGGQNWLCNWAWDNPDVMEQLLNSAGFYGFGSAGSMITISGDLEDIRILCEDPTYALGEGFSGCSISSDGTYVDINIDPDRIWEAIGALSSYCEPLTDCTLTGDPSWSIFIGPVPPRSEPLDIGPH